jgi:hypothetical protein
MALIPAINHPRIAVEHASTPAPVAVPAPPAAGCSLAHVPCTGSHVCAAELRWTLATAQRSPPFERLRPLQPAPMASRLGMRSSDSKAEWHHQLCTRKEKAPSHIQLAERLAGRPPPNPRAPLEQNRPTPMRTRALECRLHPSGSGSGGGGLSGPVTPMGGGDRMGGGCVGGGEAAARSQVRRRRELEIGAGVASGVRGGDRFLGPTIAQLVMGEIFFGWVSCKYPQNSLYV